MSNKSKVFSLRALFVVVAGVIAISLFLAVYCNYHKPTIAKAANNEPSTSDITYTEFTISIPGNIYSESISGARSYYTLPFLIFRIYSTPDAQVSGGLNADTLKYYNVQSSSFSTIYLFDSQQSVSVTTWYSPQVGSTITKIYGTTSLTKTRISDGLCVGSVSSYEIGTNLTAPYNMFYVRFYFTGGGYKQYSFECLFNPFYPVADFPIKYNISNSIIGSQESFSAGYTDGYKDGYGTGEAKGNSVGYNNGYKKGYNDGRSAPEYSFKEFFISFGDSFITIFNSILDYDFLGINVAALVGTVVVVIVVIVFVKKFLSK